MNLAFPETRYKGLLVIGDPHLEGRIPGFRKDDYPEVVLGKIRWCLTYAAEESLLPVIAGDLFHLPRNNPNWLLVAILRDFTGEILGIYGNHDVHENRITDDDSISVIAKAGAVTLLDEAHAYSAIINGRRVVVGGTPWGERLPDSFDAADDDDPSLVIWVTHHDVIVPGYEEQGRIRPRPLPGIDLVVNGHIHRRLETVEKENTRWLTPGNISRRSRSDAVRSHRPSALRIDIGSGQPVLTFVTVPHKPFEEVFYEAVIDAEPDASSSAFVAGLAELQARRTQTGEGLAQFLKKNLTQFAPDIAEEIRQLAREVMENDE